MAEALANATLRTRVGAVMTVCGFGSAATLLGGFEVVDKTLTDWAGGQTPARWAAACIVVGLIGSVILIGLPGPVAARRAVQRRAKANPVRLGGMGSGLFLVAYAIVRVADDSVFRTASLLSGGLLFVASATPGLRERLGITSIKTPGGFELSFLDAADRREDLAESPEPFDEDVGAATLAIDEAIAALLSKLPDELAGCSAKLFFYDPADNSLKAAFDSEGGGDKAWKVGTGTTGIAWLSRNYEWAIGDSVWNDDFNVPESRRAQCKRFTAVASLPLFDSSRRHPIAVLSISTEAEQPTLGDVTTPAYLAHVRLSEIIEYLLNLSTDHHHGG